MDIPRPELPRPRRRRILYVTCGLLVLVLITVGLSRLEPRPHGGQGADLDRHGPARGDVAPGARQRHTRARGDRLDPDPELRTHRAHPGAAGAAVKAETVLLELSNPRWKRTPSTRSGN